MDGGTQRLVAWIKSFRIENGKAPGPDDIPLDLEVCFKKFQQQRRGQPQPAGDSAGDQAVAAGGNDKENRQQQQQLSRGATRNEVSHPRSGTCNGMGHTSPRGDSPLRPSDSGGGSSIFSATPPEVRRGEYVIPDSPACPSPVGSMRQLELPQAVLPQRARPPPPVPPPAAGSSHRSGAAAAALHAAKPSSLREPASSRLLGSGRPSVPGGGTSGAGNPFSRSVVGGALRRLGHSSSLTTAQEQSGEGGSIGSIGVAAPFGLALSGGGSSAMLSSSAMLLSSSQPVPLGANTATGAAAAAAGAADGSGGGTVSPVLIRQGMRSMAVGGHRRFGALAAAQQQPRQPPQPHTGGEGGAKQPDQQSRELAAEPTRPLCPTHATSPLAPLHREEAQAAPPVAAQAAPATAAAAATAMAAISATIAAPLAPPTKAAAAAATAAPARSARPAAAAAAAAAADPPKKAKAAPRKAAAAAAHLPTKAKAAPKKAAAASQAAPHAPAAATAAVVAPPDGVAAPTEGRGAAGSGPGLARVSGRRRAPRTPAAAAAAAIPAAAPAAATVAEDGKRYMEGGPAEYVQMAAEAPGVGRKRPVRTTRAARGSGCAAGGRAGGGRAGAPRRGGLELYSSGSEFSMGGAVSSDEDDEDDDDVGSSSPERQPAAKRPRKAAAAAAAQPRRRAAARVNRGGASDKEEGGLAAGTSGGGDGPEQGGEQKGGGHQAVGEQGSGGCGAAGPPPLVPQQGGGTAAPSAAAAADAARCAGAGPGGAAGPRRLPGKEKKPKERQNFVRCNLGKRGGGSGSRRFMARSANTNTRGKPGRGGRGGGRYGRFQPTALKMAGEGKDYLEGWSDPKGGLRGRQQACFKCGQAGHWAKECPNMVDLDQELEKREAAADGSGAGPSAAAGPSSDTTVGTTAAAIAAGSAPLRNPSYLAAATDGAAAAVVAAAPACRDYSRLLEEEEGGGPGGEGPSEEALEGVLREVWGHGGFRGTQLQVVRRVLGGASTLAIMPTGAGKSLCYQLPALLLPGLALVVSPLIALMKDQLGRLPHQLPAGMLWGAQSKQDAEKVLQGVRCREIKVLFVAPERLHSTPLLEALQSVMPLSLVCVDEAHCVTEWGHNFRPAYFRLGYALRSRLKARCVLGLTATATAETQRAVAEVLGIGDDDVVRGPVVRENLRLHVTRLRGGGDIFAAKRALLALFRPGGALEGCRCAIVYCTFQAQTQDVAAFLYANGVTAMPYHAGKPPRERDAVQEAFLSGRCRVVVATVAFGMGIDAPHVRGVVHLTMPRSIEDYVQQVGRAGRDGAEAHCHVFLDDSDFVRLRSLASSDGVDKPAIRCFLGMIFEGPSPCGPKGGSAKAAAAAAAKRRVAASAAGGRAGGSGGGRARAGASGWGRGRGSKRASVYAAAAVAERWSPHRVLGVKKLTGELDVKEETLETVLSYLEASEPCYLQVLPGTSTHLTVAFYDVPPERLAPHHECIAALLRCCKRSRNGCYTVQMGSITADLDASPYQVMRLFQALAVSDQVRVELSADKALAAKVLLRPQSDAELDALAEQLASRLGSTRRGAVERLDTVYRTLAAAVQAGEDSAAGYPLAGGAVSWPPQQQPPQQQPDAGAAGQQQEREEGQQQQQQEREGQQEEESEGQQQQRQQEGGEGGAPPGVADAFGCGSGGGDGASTGVHNGSGAADNGPSNGGNSGGAAQPATMAMAPPTTLFCSSALEAVLVSNVAAYFDGRPLVAGGAQDLDLPVRVTHPGLEMDINALLAYIARSLPGVVPTPRAVARILHGISSPAWPADTWCKYRDWGRRKDVDFDCVMQAAQEQGVGEEDGLGQEGEEGEGMQEEGGSAQGGSGQQQQQQQQEEQDGCE